MHTGEISKSIKNDNYFRKNYKTFSGGCDKKDISIWNDITGKGGFQK